MKKVVGILLVMVCVVSLIGCGKSNDKSKDDTATIIKEPKDLEGKKIGVQLGTTGDTAISDEFGDENVERFNKGFEAVQSLLQGKVDAVVIDDQPAKEFIKENKELSIVKTAYVEEDYAMCFNKDNKELVGNVNKAIKELKDNGTFDKIVNYYITGTEEKSYESPEGMEYPNGTLIMGTNAEFPPYEFHEGGKIVGIDADFARAIADSLGMELKIEDMAFDAVIPAVKSGKVDFGAAGMTVTEEREMQVDFADSYFTGRQVIIVKDK